MLLLCVSSTDSCRSLLSQPRWIAVLLGLLRLGPPYAKRRALRLIRRLLPHCDPESLADGGGGGDDDSDGDGDALGQPVIDGTDWSIVSIVKELGAGAAVASVAAGAQDDETGGGGGDGVGGDGIVSGPPIVRVTSLSNSIQANLIPARSLLCFFLDAIGGAYQTTPLPDWLGDAEGIGNVAAIGGGDSSQSYDGRAVGATLRDLRSWHRGQAGPSTTGREQGRSAWTFSQLEAPLVCESVALLRTLLQTPSWGAVTATLLQDALQRGNSCLRMLAREAADIAEAAAAAAAAAASTPPTPAEGTGAEVGTVAAEGSGGERSNDVAATSSGVVGTASPPLGSSEATGDTIAAVAGAPHSSPVVSSGATAGPHRVVLTGEGRPGRTTPIPAVAAASVGPSADGTLLRTLGALSVLGGHVDVLYPGASAEIMPLDSGAASRGASGGSRGAVRGSQASSGGWGVRMGRSVFGLERAAGVAGAGVNGRGGGMGGDGTIPGSVSSTAAASAAGGRPCVVISLSLAEGHADVILGGEDGSGSCGTGGSSGGGSRGAGSARPVAGGGIGGDDARKPLRFPLDCLQAVPNVPVLPGILPPDLAPRVLETLTLWCLDKSLSAAFSERLSPTIVPLVPPLAAGRSSTSRQANGDEGKEREEGLSGVLSTTVLDRHLLLGLVRCQAAKAAQTLLLHPPTASDFIKAASAPAPGRKAKGGAGAVLLEVASGVSASAGLGDIGAMEELLAMLLVQWQFVVLDGRSKKLQEARSEYL